MGTVELLSGLLRKKPRPLALPQASCRHEVVLAAGLDEDHVSLPRVFYKALD
jgi:hypothetical protein